MTDADPSGGGPADPWAAPGRRAAVLAGLTLLTRLPGLVASRPFNTDEATLALGGRTMADGGTLYVDLIDRKPPLPFAAYALLGTHDLRPVRALIAVLVLVAALVVADEAGRRWDARAGWAAGIVLVLGASALGANDAQAANFELFALLPIVVAVVAAARGRAAVAGAALAVAVLCKQPAAVTIVPVAWCWWRTGRWRHVGLGLVAGAIAGVALAAPFGIGRVLDWALLGTGGYLGFSAGDVGNALLRLLALAAIAAGFWGGAGLLVAAARDRRHETATATSAAGSPVTGERDLWLLLGVSLVAVLPGLRLFPHYLLQALPAVALLAAFGLTRRPARLLPALAWGVAASVVGAVLAWSWGLSPPPAVETDVAAYVRANTSADEEVLVWGNEPEVYWRADRRPAGGFPHSEFVTGHSGGRRPRLAGEDTVDDPELYRAWLARLRADPPALIVDTAAADLRGGRWFPIARFDGLAELIATRYERVATVDDVPVYRLEDPAP